MPQAKFIGGPWDGVTISIKDVYEYYEVAELEPMEPWSEPRLDDPLHRVSPNRVRYTLYDDWPVKYLAEGLK